MSTRTSGEDEVMQTSLSRWNTRLN